MPPRVHPHGYWLDEAPPHKHDAALAGALVRFFRRELPRHGRVADFGCGDGRYVKRLREAGLRAVGFDGNPHVGQITGGVGKRLDLTAPELQIPVFDWLLSLEVAEHVPPQREAALLTNLDHHNRYGLVLSWAVRGQPGTGHVNCRDNAEVLDLFIRRGYSWDETATESLRQSATLSWFQNTLLVLRKAAP